MPYRFPSTPRGAISLWEAIHDFTLDGTYPRSWIPRIHNRFAWTTPGEGIEAAFNACIAQLGAGKTQIEVPPGTYPLAGTVDFLGKSDFSISSIGNGTAVGGDKGAVFQANSHIRGGAGWAARFKMQQCVNARFEGLGFKQGGFAGSMFQLRGGNFTTFERCSWYGRATGAGSAGPRFYLVNVTNVGTDELTLGHVTDLAVGDRVDFRNAGDSTRPGGTLGTTPYYIRSLVGLVITLSADPDLVSLVNITSGHTGTHVWLMKKSCVIDGYDDTTTIRQWRHGFVNGDCVRAYNRSQHTLSGILVPVQGRNWVINATEHTYQLAAVPTGVGFDVPITLATTAGGGAHMSLAECSIAGGGLEYFKVRNCFFGGNADPVFIQAKESVSLGSYYGMDNNASEFSNNVVGTSGSFSGHCTIAHNQFQGPGMADIYALLIGDWESASTVTHAYDNYFELGIPHPNMAAGVRVKNGICEFNNVYGAGLEMTGVDGIFASLGIPSGNNIQRWDVGLRAYNPASSVSPLGSSDGAFFGGNGFANNGTDQVYWPRVQETDTVGRMGIMARSEVGLCLDGATLYTRRRTFLNPTALDLKLGPIFSIQANAPHTIATLTNNGSGLTCKIYAETGHTTLGVGATGFITLSGADYKMALGETVNCFANSDWTKLVVEQPMGSVVAGTPAALAGTLTTTVGDTALFSGAPTPGTYEFEIVGTVTAAGAGTTTLTIPLKWTDAVGARTHNLVLTHDLVAGATTFTGRLTIKVVSGNPTLGATFNTPSGTPGVLIDVTGKRTK